ncbi:MAG: SDR family NAD(P)-dependent oxidoreductase [Spirochaetaceae bacterium]|nr:MAG: SDR family NAD(P)-dependent oxidoreductase [Spirochaetaceae bacterium]
MDNKLGATAFITGGSSGIGLAIAREFVRHGTNVAIFSRNADARERAVATLTASARSGASIRSYALDVSDREQTRSAFAEAVADIGVARYVVTSVGVAYPGYFEAITDEEFDETWRVNVAGTWNVLQAVVPYMKSAGGHVLTVSSVAGFVGPFGYTAYSASKFAVIGMSEVLRSELKRFGIRVSVLCPPDTDTPQLAQETLRKPRETVALSRHARIATPESVARAAIAGMERNRFLILPGRSVRFVHAMQRFFPAVVRFVSDREVMAAQRKESR